MKKNLFMFLLAGTLLTLLITGGVMAWFTDSETVTNNFEAGTVAIKVIENANWSNPNYVLTNWNPGDTTAKPVSVKSEGSKLTYVRVKLTPEWTNPTTNLPETNLTLNMSTSTKWVLLNGWYYYKELLETNEVTDLLLESVTLVGNLTGNEYQGASLKIDVLAEAVQASNGANVSQWALSAADLTAIGFEMIP